MRMGYNPNDLQDTGASGGSAEPGDYNYVVAEAEEVTFKSGNTGIKLTLMIQRPNGSEIKAFENLVYHARALWKIDEFLSSVGLNFRNPPGVHELLHRNGRAKFIKNDRDYLSVDKYYPKAQETYQPPANRPMPQVQPQHAAAYQQASPDDVPF